MISKYWTYYFSSQDKNLLNEAEITIEPVDAIKSPVKKHGRHSSMDLAANGNTSITQLLEKCVSADAAEEKVDSTDGNTATKEEGRSPNEGCVWLGNLDFKKCVYDFGRLAQYST